MLLIFLLLEINIWSWKHGPAWKRTIVAKNTIPIKLYESKCCFLAIFKTSLISLNFQRAASTWTFVDKNTKQ